MKKILLAFALLAAPLAGLSTLAAYPAAAAATVTELGDMSSFIAIVTDTQAIAAKGDFAAAEKRITDFETAWDAGQRTLRPLNKSYWGNIDDASDAALDALRASTPAAADVNTTLAALISELDNPALVAGQSDAAAGSAAATATTDADGRPIPCEELLKTTKDAIPSVTIAAADKAKVDELIVKGTERCNADDDKRADGFFADALKLMGK